MRFSRGEVVFYRLKIRSKTANVAELMTKKGSVKTFWVATERAVHLGTFLVPSPGRTPRVTLESPFFNFK
ncbi:hypothetical protein E2C01_001604 [Portunus trituberculatus]|uniref:Uncharacterized protein n=1 Tax=Portunus trituberculatus TaxID=210409 RepID=A0A5B7CKU9_PORTR|nr:hypothetical protein [Portunus trituberculatus]